MKIHKKIHAAYGLSVSSRGYLFIETDDVKDYGPIGMSNRHYHVIGAGITSVIIDDKFDFITHVSVLEHIQESVKTCFRC